MSRKLMTQIGVISARVLTGLLFLCVLLGGYAGYINPSTWVLPAILCLVFPIIWIIAFVVTILWVILGKERITKTICIVLMFTTLPAILMVSPITNPAKLGDDERALKFITYNVAGLTDYEKPSSKYSRTVSYILNSGADIVCLQECYSLYMKKVRGGMAATEAQQDSLKSIYPYQIMGSSEEESVLSKYPVSLVNGFASTDMSYFNVQLYEVDVEGYKIKILNVHMPSYRLDKSQKAIASKLKNDPSQVLDEQANLSLYSKLKNAFITRADAADVLADMIDTIKGPLILSGDFNDVPCSYTWRRMRNAGMQDAYTEAGKGPMITYNAGHLWFHIDQVFYRPDMGMRALNVSRGKQRSSDHYPVSVTFAIKK